MRLLYPIFLILSFTVGQSKLFAQDLSLSLPNSCRRGKIIQIKLSGTTYSDTDVMLTDSKGVSKQIGTFNRDNPLFSWQVPKDQQTGNYKIAIGSSGQVVSGTEKALHIKPRTAFIVKFLPIAAAGAAAYVLLGGKSNSSSSLPGIPPVPNN